MLLGFDKERLGEIISQTAINTKIAQKKMSLIKTSLSIMNIFIGGYQRSSLQSPKHRQQSKKLWTIKAIL
jgi:hypothetical protein